VKARIRLIAVTTAMAVAALFVTGAGMPPDTAHQTMRSAHAADAPVLVIGEELDTPAEAEEVLGQPGLPAVYPTVDTSTQPDIPGAIETVLENVAGGVLTTAVVYAGTKLFKIVKKYIWKGTGTHQKLYQNAGDGRCLADFTKGQITYLANCSDKTGIYWSYSGEGKLWNNHTGDMLTASSNNNGTKLYDWYPPTDWYTWTWGYVCANSSCSEVYGEYWALYNSQSHMISDTTAASVG
jgi:hypothetical protein